MCSSELGMLSMVMSVSMKFSWSEPVPSPSPPPPSSHDGGRSKKKETSKPLPIKVLDAPPRHRSPRTPMRKRLKKGGGVVGEATSSHTSPTTTIPQRSRRRPSSTTGGGGSSPQLLYKKDVKLETAAIMRELVSEKKSSNTPRIGVPNINNSRSDIRNLVTAAAGRSKEIERQQQRRMVAVLGDKGRRMVPSSSSSSHTDGGLIISKRAPRSQEVTSSSRVRSESGHSITRGSPKKMQKVTPSSSSSSSPPSTSSVGAFSWKAVVPTSSLPLSDHDDDDDDTHSTSSSSVRNTRHRFHGKRKKGTPRGGDDQGSNASWSLPSSEDDSSSNEGSDDDEWRTKKKKKRQSNSTSSSSRSNSVLDGYDSFLRVSKARKKVVSGKVVDETVLKRLWRRLSDSDKEVWKKEDIRQLAVQRLRHRMKKEPLTSSNFTSWCDEMRSLKDPHLGDNKIVDVTLLMTMLQRLSKQPLDGKSIFKHHLKKDILPMLQSRSGWGLDLNKVATTGWLLPIARSIKTSFKKLIMADGVSGPTSKKRNHHDEEVVEEEKAYLSSVKEVKSLLAIDTTTTRVSSPRKKQKDGTPVAATTTTTASIDEQRSKVRVVLQTKALADEEVEAATKAALALEEALWDEYARNVVDGLHGEDVQQRQLELKEYYSRVRTLTFNLRQNGRLRARLLGGEDEYSKVLAVMSVEEMATEEQQASRRDAVERGLKAVVRQEKETLVEDRQKIMDLHQRNDSPDQQQEHDNNNNSKPSTILPHDDKVGDGVV